MYNRSKHVSKDKSEDIVKRKVVVSRRNSPIKKITIKQKSVHRINSKGFSFAKNCLNPKEESLDGSHISNIYIFVFLIIITLGLV